MKKSMKLIRFVGYGLLAISVILIIAFLATSNFTTFEFPMIDTVLNWTYIMLGLAALTAVVLPLLNMMQNPKAMVRSLMGIAVVVVVILVCYILADDTPLVTVANATFDNPTALLISDAGLYATYFAFAVAVIGIVAGELYTTFKK